MNAIVLFGDVIRSRRNSTGSTAWLRTLAAELEAAYPSTMRLANFEFTQGDELQGLLVPGADPILAILRAWLHPEHAAMRWVVVAGEVDPGSGPATQRTGPAFLTARARLAEAAARRDLCLMSTGTADADRLLDDLPPLLAAHRADQTIRQRDVARLVLDNGLRRSEAAERLDISRATVSVAAKRAHLRSIEGLAAAIRTIFIDGAAAAGEERVELR
jgi:DNA-binding NarL/FixJ family response regulator